MTTTASFPLPMLERLRKKAAMLAETPLDSPEGWSKSPIDPMEVVAVFKDCLWIKQGNILRAYLLRKEGKGEGVVWAMPADAYFPEPRYCPKVRHINSKLPKPFGSLADMREAIDGDGSPWSHLCASILLREFGGFGSISNRAWHTITILGRNPLKGRKQELGDPAAWRWHQPEPKVWNPQVTEDGDKITVDFYIFSGHGGNDISRFRDTYRKGSYCYKNRNQWVATGPGGFEFDGD